MALNPWQAGLGGPPVWSPNPGASAFSLAEQIAEQLGNAIIRGELSPGERVREEAVADRFSVSRGPVREALRILERDGLVRMQARRGARVTQLTIDEVDEVFELRCALLGVAARRVAEGGDRVVGAAIKRGTELLRKLSHGEDSDAYVSEAHRLNMTIADASGSELLRGMYFSLAYRTLRYTRLSLASERRRRQSARKWKLLASAIEARDAEAAGELAETLVRDSRNAVVAILRARSTEEEASVHEEDAPRQSNAPRRSRRNRPPDSAKAPRSRNGEHGSLL